MPVNMSSDFIVAKNTKIQKPVWLLRIEVAEGQDDLYLCPGPDNIDYFETNAGVDTARTYLKWPMRITGAGQNSLGEIDTLQLKVGNVSREIEALMQLYKYFRGNKATLRFVWRDKLASPNNHIEYIFNVDSHQSDARYTAFQLKNPINLFGCKMPRQLMMQGYCRWRGMGNYKKLGCWEDDGDGNPQQPASFYADKTMLFDSGERGSDPLVPSATSFKQLRFSPRSYFGLVTLATDQLIIDIKGGPIANNTASYVKFGTAGGGALKKNDLRGFGINAVTFSTLTLDLSDFVEDGGPPDYNNLNLVEVSIEWLSGDHTLTFKNVFLLLNSPFGVLLDDRDVCNGTPGNCRIHNNIARFGGVPAADKTGVTILG